MPIFMKFGDIKGDVTAEGHLGSDGWVEVTSFKFSVGRSISMATGNSTNREADAPSVSEIIVTKPADVSTPAFLEASLHGEGVDVQIDFCKTDKDKLEVWQYYKLINTMISGFSVEGTSEAIALTFTKIEHGYNQMDSTNAAGDTPKFAWDVAKAKAA
jgi:type VI secretion system secreted protein Hcp